MAFGTAGACRMSQNVPRRTQYNNNDWERYRGEWIFSVVSAHSPLIVRSDDDGKTDAHMENGDTNFRRDEKTELFIASLCVLLLWMILRRLV